MAELEVRLKEICVACNPSQGEKLFETFFIPVLDEMKKDFPLKVSQPLLFINEVLKWSNRWVGIPEKT